MMLKLNTISLRTQGHKEGTKATKLIVNFVLPSDPSDLLEDVLQIRN
jgi:hypothetical protein